MFTVQNWTGLNSELNLIFKTLRIPTIVYTYKYTVLIKSSELHLIAVNWISQSTDQYIAIWSNNCKYRSKAITSHKIRVLFTGMNTVSKSYFM